MNVSTKEKHVYYVAYFILITMSLNLFHTAPAEAGAAPSQTYNFT